MSCGSACRGRFGSRVLQLSSSIGQGPGGHLQVCRVMTSNGQAWKIWHKLSNQVSAAGGCLPQRQWIGTSEVCLQHTWRRCSSRVNSSENNSDKEPEGKTNENMSLEDELVEEFRQEVVDGNRKSGRQNQDSQDDNGGDHGEEETAPSKKSVQKPQMWFWRQFWKPGESSDVNQLSPEEKVLLEDLESLTFNWKDTTDPTLENVLALSFAALLTWALVKILWQLVLVVTTIVLSALKYTVLATFLAGFLIFLL